MSFNRLGTDAKVLTYFTAGLARADGFNDFEFSLRQAFECLVEFRVGEIFTFNRKVDGIDESINVGRIHDKVGDSRLYDRWYICVTCDQNHGDFEALREMKCA